MKNKRKQAYVVAFCIYTVANLLLNYKIHGSKEVRDSWQQVYIEPFRWWDVFVCLGISGVVYLGVKLFLDKAVPWIREWMKNYAWLGREQKKTVFFPLQIFMMIYGIWFFFFMVFYPGTAMNDTIFILEDPWELSRQHPIFYNLYTYGMYALGCKLGNPNLGLAFISLFQMLGMALVLTHAITLLYRKGLAKWLCRLIALYFSIAPLFPTYAVSAIKDTPFSICLFALLLQLYELAQSDGTLLKRKGFLFGMVVEILGILSFRNNGAMIVIGVGVVLCVYYRHYWKRLALVFGLTMLIQCTLVMQLKPEQAEAWFQEKAAIPIQQVAAVVVKGEALTTKQEAYLYRLLPRDAWEQYAPECCDTIKWDKQFDREFLNQTKAEFLKIWLQLVRKNPKVCIEAYLLETYGVWGIETRNKEQYYFKDIWENNLGLEQKSPLPNGVKELVSKFYCNRFTYRYLSQGTAFWLLIAVTLWGMYRKKYALVITSVPLWILFVSLLVATPVAFCFRYVFVMAMVIPFMVLLPFDLEVCEGEKGT